MKRIIFQCDKCLKTAERPDMPKDWIEVSATIHEFQRRTQTGSVIKTWCPPCWKEISAPYPQPEKLDKR